eukprot:NODE_900_length_3262_cov_0.670250.p3 type:complete len:155 gc:universal NODE_900_length_3262_cov_0.670250:2356-2820(+)
MTWSLIPIGRGHLIPRLNSRFKFLISFSPHTLASFLEFDLQKDVNLLSPSIYLVRSLNVMQEVLYIFRAPIMPTEDSADAILEQGKPTMLPFFICSMQLLPILPEYTLPSLPVLIQPLIDCRISLLIHLYKIAIVRPSKHCSIVLMCSLMFLSK